MIRVDTSTRLSIGFSGAINAYVKIQVTFSGAFIAIDFNLVGAYAVFRIRPNAAIRERVICRDITFTYLPRHRGVILRYVLLLYNHLPQLVLA
jgi:hypothetical protein